MSNDGFNLSGSLDAVSHRYSQIIEGASKIIAVFALLLAALVSFTDVSFADFGSATFTSTLLVILVSSYLIYFSLYDAGEKLGESGSEYTAAIKRYTAAREKITPSDIPHLRDYLTDYSLGELEWRKSYYLAQNGVTRGDKEPSEISKKERRILRRAERMRCVYLTPVRLLSLDRTGRRSELESPERSKFFSTLLALLPSTLCTFFTVSVILTAKDGLSASAVLEAIIKLATLPIIGFKGYLGGYEFAKEKKCGFIETKTRLIESFLEKGAREGGRTS